MRSLKKNEVVFFPPTAEKLLTHIPPAYGYERKHIFIRSASTVLLFVFLIPFVVTDYLHRKRNQECKRRAAETSVQSEPTKIRDNGQSKRSKKKSKADHEAKKDDDTIDESEVEVERVFLPWYCMPFLNLCAFYGVILLLATSSNNTYGARGIFEAPFLSAEECQAFIKVCDYKSRPNLSTTVLLNSLSDQDKIMLVEKFDLRLAPLIERIYGIVPRAVHADQVCRFADFFIVSVFFDKLPSHSLISL